MGAAAFEALATTGALTVLVLAAMGIDEAVIRFKARRIQEAVPGMSKTTARALAQPNVHDEEVWR